MTDNETESTDGVPLDDLPLENTRRTLLRVLGGGAAIGGVSGIAAGVTQGEAEGDEDDADTANGLADDDEDESDEQDTGDDDAATGQGLSFIVRDMLDVDGLSTTGSAITIEEVSLDDPSESEPTDLLSVNGLQVTVENDSITGADVENVDMHDAFEAEVETIIGALANGRTPLAFNALPKPVVDRVESADSSELEQLDRQTNGARSVSDLIETGVSNVDGNSSGFLSLLQVFVLLVAIVVVIGIFFGGTLPDMVNGSDGTNGTDGESSGDSDGETLSDGESGDD